MKKTLFLLCFICTCITSGSHINGQTVLNSLDLTAGINFEFGYNWGGGSYVSISVAAGVSKNFYYKYRKFDEVEKQSCIDGGNTVDCNFDFDNLNKYQQFFNQNASPSYQAAFNIYFNSIGDNILDDFKSVNIDFVNSLMFTFGNQKDSSLLHQNELIIKTFNSQTAGVVKDYMDNSITLGTNFVLNNTNRNQRVGFMNLNVGRFLVVHYYNDGPPYTGFSSDGFDRWWTGGGSLDLYFNQIYQDEPNFLQNSRVTIAYDRFTGNVQNAFNSADLFGFYYVPTKDLKQNFYNTSKFKAGIRFFEDDFEVSYVKLGKLRNEVQDLIHKITANPVHLTYSKGRHYLGVNYNPVLEFQIK